jgi:Tfp pilus assembly protein PilZ
VNIATSKEELEKAYSLLHDAYVGMNLMAPEPSGLRCNFYTFLPYTTTVVAKIGDSVVGTVSLIKDSAAGLPSDKDFKKENDELRLKGHHLVEVSSLATDKEVRRKGHVVSLYMMKYLQHYTTNYMGCSTVTCVIHPRATDFYAAFWGFSASKKIVKYKFVNDALGVQVFGNITDKFLPKLAKFFPETELLNPIKFLYREEPCLKYPERNFQTHLDPVFTPELLSYFSEKTNAFDKLTKEELITVYSAYSLFFDNLESLPCFKTLNLELFKRKNFRFYAGATAKIKSSENEIMAGYISDISENGAFFATSAHLELGQTYMMKFELGPLSFDIPVNIRWRNRRIRNNNRVGYGVQFAQTQMSIARMLRQTHLMAAKAAEVPLIEKVKKAV